MRPSHGLLPLEISHNITPRLKMSDFFPRLYDSFSKVTGSIYAVLPSPFDVEVQERPLTVTHGYTYCCTNTQFGTI